MRAKRYAKRAGGMAARLPLRCSATRARNVNRMWRARARGWWAGWRRHVFCRQRTITGINQPAKRHGTNRNMRKRTNKPRCLPRSYGMQNNKREAFGTSCGQRNNVMFMYKVRKCVAPHKARVLRGDWQERDPHRYREPKHAWRSNCPGRTGGGENE